MDKIQITRIQRLSNLEVFSLYKSCLEFAKKSNPIALKIEKEVALFEAKLIDFESMLKYSFKTVETDRLASLDSIREDLLQGLKFVVKANIRFPEIKFHDAALNIQTFLDRYHKNIARMPYLESSSLVHHMVEQLHKESFWGDIEILGLERWINQLETVNQEFVELYASRNRKQSSYVNNSTQNRRVATQNSFINLCEMINIYSRLDGEYLYKELIDEINQSIEDAKLKHNQRRSHRKVKDTHDNIKNQI